MKKTKRSIRRYTSFASLVAILSERRITLLDPETWDDKNDVFYMGEYRRRRNENVYALCLSRSDQTYHHWRVFAGSPDGVCIEFDDDAFRSIFENEDNVEIGEVIYKNISDARSRKPLKDHDLKFLKHNRYKAEQETRVVYTGPESFPKYQFELSDINRITLSPWLSQPLVGNVRKLLRKIDGCEGLKIYRSTLVNFQQWKDLAVSDRKMGR